MIFSYILLQSVCVVTSTIKSVILIKGSKTAAVLLNTLHYIINAGVTYLIGRAAELDIWTILITATITNLVGVWAGLTITDKMRKEQLWRISATVKAEHYAALITDLKNAEIKFVTFETDWDKVKLIDIFSNGKAQSSVVRQLFKQYDIKYTIAVHSGTQL